MEGVKLVKIGREACPRCKVWDNMLENQFPDLEIQHINVDFERENITMEMATALRGQTALPFLLIEKDGQYTHYPPNKVSAAAFKQALEA